MSDERNATANTADASTFASDASAEADLKGTSPNAVETDRSEAGSAAGVYVDSAAGASAVPAAPAGASYSSDDIPFSVAWLEAQRMAIRPVLHEEIVGNEHAVSAADTLIWRLTHVNEMRGHGAEPPRGVLLFGGPGLGKTMLARYIATRLGADVRFYSLPLEGLSPARIRGTLAYLDATGARSIIYLDEIDGFAKVPPYGTIEPAAERNLRLAFLSAMDGPSSGDGALVIASTNLAMGEIQPALVRSGRMSTHISFAPPQRDERELLLRQVAKTRRTADDVDFAALADVTGGMSPADLVQAFDDALGAALARGAEGEISHSDLLRSLSHRGLVLPTAASPDPEVARQVLLHELGHAVTNTVLRGPTAVERIMLTGGGEAHVASLSGHGLSISETFVLQQMIILVSGRVAEQVLTGKVTLGSTSDMSNLDNVWEALIINGIWLELTDSYNTDHEPRMRKAEARTAIFNWATECARRIVTVNAELITGMADAVSERLNDENPALSNSQWMALLEGRALRTPPLDAPPITSPTFAPPGLLTHEEPNVEVAEPKPTPVMAN